MIPPDAPRSTDPAHRPSVASWLRGRPFLPIYVALVIAFVLQVARFHDSQTGFTPLVFFGDHYAPKRIARLRDVPLYTLRNSDGYDGQFYAQIAVAGNPFDPGLRTALDAPAYRLRRILLPALAHLAGLGRPVWVLAAYALSNVAAWLILAWVTARWWFPPTSLQNLVRWIGTMFGAGMLVSVARSLTDGPALLLIALGVRCVELNRRWLAAAVLGLAGLARETSILAGAAFVQPSALQRKPRVFALLAPPLCVLPAALWMVVLAAHFHGDSGSPIEWGVPAFLKECRTLYFTLRTRGFFAARDDVYVFVGLLVQLGFVLGRPRPALAWWRVGAAFAIVPLLGGWAFWGEDLLNAIPRTTLPLTLAFNVLAPRGRGGLALLLVGNLTALSARRALDVAPGEQTNFVDGITCNYASGWYPVEHSRIRSWRWASGPAVLKLHNPQGASLRVGIDFEIQSRTDRTVDLSTADLRTAVALQPLRGVGVHFGPFELPPGDTSIALDTAEPPWTEPGPHGRELTFSVQHLAVTSVPPPN
jgi:hypothetical protein